MPLSTLGGGLRLMDLSNYSLPLIHFNYGEGKAVLLKNEENN